MILMGNLHFANFNVTFGKDKKPLLDCFETIIYPAFTSDIRKKGRNENGEIELFFDEVTVTKLDNGEYILAGYFIKDTFVKVETIHDGKKLIVTNKKYPTSPYSIFVLFLKNHRVVLYQNEQQSPNLRSFNAAVRDILGEYIKTYNEKLSEKEKKLKLPKASVHIVGLALMATSIEEQLASVEKIAEMRVKLYPLNGDCEFNDVFASMRTVNECVDSKNSKYILSSPKSKKGVSTVIANSNGLVDITLDVRYKNGSKGKIKSEHFTETIPFKTDTDDFSAQVNQISSKSLEMPEMKKCSEENKNIFKRNIDKIMNCISSKF